MIGIEIVRDQKTKERGADLRNHIVDLAFRRGLCILGAGENTLRLSPPLLINREQADAALAILEQCIHDVEAKALTKFAGRHIRHPVDARRTYGRHWLLNI